MIWDEKAECMSEGARRAMTSSRLKEAVRRAYEKIPCYRQAFDTLGLKPEHVQGIQDLEKLPFTTKKDIQSQYPFGFLTVPLEQVVTLHASSGTTGKPIVMGYTSRDLDLWAEMMARTLTAGGVSKGDLIHNAYGYGLFTGGLGLHYGALRVGATVVPISGGLTDRQVMLLKDFRPTVLTCTPSYALHLGEEAARAGLTPDQLNLRIGVLGAEPWSEGLRKEVEARLGLWAQDIYGLCEMIGPGVAFECQLRQGLHINEDHFIPEVIDPETQKPLADGQLGELVFTAVSKEAAPILRFRTRDITRLTRGQCACGRTMVRMDRLTGRADDMLIVRGVNFFPSQLESILMEFTELDPQYLIVVNKKGALDEVEIFVEAKESYFASQLHVSPRTAAVAQDSSCPYEFLDRDPVAEGVSHRLRGLFGLRMEVRVVAPRSLERSTGKAKRVLDLRKTAAS